MREVCDRLLHRLVLGFLTEKRRKEAEEERRRRKEAERFFWKKKVAGKREEPKKKKKKPVKKKTPPIFKRIDLPNDKEEEEDVAPDVIQVNLKNLLKH